MTITSQLSFPFEAPSSSQDLSDFCVSKSNKEAFQFVLSWPKWPVFCGILYGPEGSGKSHLASIYQKLSGAVPYSLSLEAIPTPPRVENFSTPSGIENFPQTLTIENLPQTPTVMDNLDLSGGLSHEQEEQLFHLYNHLKGIGQTLFISTSSPPSAWKAHLPDLMSRLRSSCLIKLDLPDDGLLKLLYVKRFSDHQISVSSQVVEYILKVYPRSFRDVHQLVTELISESYAQKKNITIPFIRNFIKEKATE